MNTIHPKSAFGPDFEGELFALMVASRPATPPSKQGRGTAFTAAPKKPASKAAALEGFQKGKMMTQPGQLMDIPHGRGTIHGIKKITKEEKDRRAKVRAGSL